MAWFCSKHHRLINRKKRGHFTEIVSIWIHSFPFFISFFIFIFLFLLFVTIVIFFFISFIGVFLFAFLTLAFSSCWGFTGYFGSIFSCILLLWFDCRWILFYIRIFSYNLVFFRLLLTILLRFLLSYLLPFSFSFSWWLLVLLTFSNDLLSSNLIFLIILCNFLNLFINWRHNCFFIFRFSSILFIALCDLWITFLWWFCFGYIFLGLFVNNNFFLCNIWNRFFLLLLLFFYFWRLWDLYFFFVFLNSLRFFFRNISIHCIFFLWRLFNCRFLYLTFLNLYLFLYRLNFNNFNLRCFGSYIFFLWLFWNSNIFLS